MAFEWLVQKQELQRTPVSQKQHLQRSVYKDKMRREGFHMQPVPEGQIDQQGLFEIANFEEMNEADQADQELDRILHNALKHMD